MTIEKKLQCKGNKLEILRKGSSVIQLFWKLQHLRYKSKGLFNCILAFALFYLIIIGGTQLGKYTWPDKIQNPKQFTVLSTLMIHFCFQMLYFAIFLPGYLGHPWYKKYLINKDMKKPWQKQNWQNMKLRTCFYLFLNKAVVFPILIYFSITFGGTKTRFKDFPSSFEVFSQLIFIMLVEDFFFFWAHKLAHSYDFLYKFHKIHHEYDSVFSLAAEYTHPVDYVIGILIPSAIPFFILGNKAHCFMLLFWQVWKIYISSEGHCGFDFPFSPTRILPFVSGPSYHDFHHSTNSGNYAGSVYLWDTFMGTNKIYFQRIMHEKQEKIQ